MISKKAFAKLYKTEDARKFTGEGSLKDQYLNKGSGSYTLRVDALKQSVRAEDSREFMVVEFTVVSAREGSTFKPGDTCSWIRELIHDAARKEAVELVCATLGVPPFVTIPEGRAHAGAMLFLVDAEKFEEVVDDPEDVLGTTIACEVYGKPKTKGAHVGKTYYNPAFRPCDEDGQPSVWPSFDKIAEAIDVDALIEAQFDK